MDHSQHASQVQPASQVSLPHTDEQGVLSGPLLSPAPHEYRTNARKQLQQHKAQIARDLGLAGVTRLEIDYGGCGDSGQIDAIIYWDAQAQTIHKSAVGDAHETLEHFCYELLEARHPGWDLDDGVFGRFTWDLNTNNLLHTHVVRLVNYETTEHEDL